MFRKNYTPPVSLPPSPSGLNSAARLMMLTDSNKKAESVLLRTFYSINMLQFVYVTRNKPLISGMPHYGESFIFFTCNAIDTISRVDCPKGRLSFGKAILCSNTAHYAGIIGRSWSWALSSIRFVCANVICRTRALATTRVRF